MSECTSIPAASGLMTWSAAAEAGTGTGSDLSRDFLGLAGLLGLVGFLGSSFGTTMDVSGSRMRVSKPLGPSFASGKMHQREYGHGHAAPDHRVETSSDQNQISQTQVHGTRGRRRRRHDRFRLRFRLVKTPAGRGAVIACPRISPVKCKPCITVCLVRTRDPW